VRITSTGAVRMALVRATATGTEVVMVPEAAMTGLTALAGERIQLRLAVTGASPTTISAKAWKAGTAEPAAWTLTTTDATSELQAAGAVGFYSYLAGSATNAPVTVSVDDVLVVAGG